MKLCFPSLIIFFVILQSSQAQYEDKRCICVCPDTLVVNGTQSNRKIYKQQVPPSKCDCEHVVLPNISEDIKEKEFCPRCECKYESRNTTTIKVVVIMALWLVTLLVVYMGFLLCLDPILNRRKAQAFYREQMDDDEESLGSGSQPTLSQPMQVRSNVLGRVTSHQDRWKRQVQEQRKNIYDKHTMLN